MYSETCTALANAAAAKARLLQDRPAAFWVSSILAGGYIGFGSVLFFSAWGTLNHAGFAAAKFMGCLLFSAALSLVVMAGSDLFTGNNLTVGMGMLQKAVTPGQAAKLWAVCWLGNLMGSLILAFCFWGAGLTETPGIADVIRTACTGKVTAAPLALLIKGFLCNVCVCLGVWCANKMRSESGKLIMIVWCILIFMCCGFEHAIANMSMLPLGFLVGTPAMTAANAAVNLAAVTAGNLLGGFVGVALPYWFLSKR